MLSGSIYFRSRDKTFKLSNNLLSFLSTILFILLSNSVNAIEVVIINLNL